MLALIAAIALAAGLASSHAHTTAVAGTHPQHVTSLDGSGGGPPIHP